MAGYYQRQEECIWQSHLEGVIVEVVHCSLQAEAVEILLLLLYIGLIAKHRKRTDIKIKYVSNNLELMNRSKEHLNYIDLYPNNTLSAEFDITEQIYLTNKTDKIKAPFQHVHGHQDTKYWNTNSSTLLVTP